MIANDTNPFYGLRGLLILIVWVGTAFSQAIADDSLARLSFGRVMPDEPIEEVIGFNNPGAEPLVVENIQLTPPLIAEDITYLILPGGEGSFNLVLGKDRQPGPFEGVVHINFKDAKHPPITFEIEGFVIPPIEFKPYAAFFVATHFGKQKTASVEIINVSEINDIEFNVRARHHQHTYMPPEHVEAFLAKASTRSEQPDTYTFVLYDIDFHL